MHTEPAHNKSGLSVLIEQVIHQNQLILENIVDMQADIAWIKPKVARIDIIEADIKTMKLAITATNKDLRQTRQDLARTNQDLARTNRELAASTKEMRRRTDSLEKRIVKIEDT